MAHKDWQYIPLPLARNLFWVAVKEVRPACFNDLADAPLAEQKRYEAAWSGSGGKRTRHVVRQEKRLAHLRLDEIADGSHVPDFRATLVERSSEGKISLKRINNILAVLSMALRYAEKQKIIPHAPEVGIFKIDAPETEWWEFGEYPACDHVEEQLFPLSAWGTSAVLARYAPRENCMNEDLALWRVVAGADDMRVVFDPPAPSPAGNEYHFAKQGDVLEFMAPKDYYVEGLFENPQDAGSPGAPFLAYQMMTGAGYTNCPVDGPDSGSMGDPMMLLTAPAGQYLDRYVFNTDNVFDFRFDHIIIVRPSGSHVALDCKGIIPDSSFTQVGSSNWEVARVFIDNPDNSTGCLDGPHLLTASEPVGLSVVGTARANSYGYLAGVGVKPINPVVIQ